MAIRAPDIHSIETILSEILDRGLHNPPEHPMLILQDLFQAGLQVNIRKVEEIMSRVAPRDPTRIEPGRWTANVDPLTYFKNHEILLLNQPHHQTGQPTLMFTAVFTQKQMEELVNNRKGKVFWYVISVRRKIA